MTRQFIRFAFAGTVGFIVDAGILYAMLEIGAGYFIGRAISFIAAVWVTWQINRKLTFTSSQDRSLWSEWWSYFCAMTAGGIVNYGVYGICVSTIHNSAVLPVVSVALGSIAGMFVNFATAKFWVFGKRRSA